MAAALVDQNSLASLRIEWAEILAAIKSKEDRFIKPKIIRLAENLELRMNLADPELSPLLTINQISTEIRRVLKSYDIPIADNVDHYLPNRFKNPNKQNFLPEDSRTVYGGIDAKLLIEELNSLPPAEITKLSPAQKTILYDTIMRNKNLIEADALEQHYELNDKKQRQPIRTPRPFEPRATKYSEEIHKHAQVLLEWEQCVINRCPPPPELEETFAIGEREAYRIYENFINEKYSLALGEWLERDLYRVHQSKHGAAVKDKVPTLLCKKCSILDREEWQQGDFVQVRWVWESPTHWKCPQCGEMENFVLRPLTREQCGDKGHERCPQCNFKFTWDVGLSPMDAMAIELVNNLPGYYNSLQYYNQLMQKCVATRKVELGVDLSSKA